MFSKNYLYLLLLSGLGIGLMYSQETKEKKLFCSNATDCTDMSNRCQCYCSHECGPRDKKSNDKPVYDAQDPHKKFCYCKDWDKENFEKRCAEREQKKS